MLVPEGVPGILIQSARCSFFGCCMHHAEGRVTTPEESPEIFEERNWGRLVNTYKGLGGGKSGGGGGKFGGGEGGGGGGGGGKFIQGLTQ